MALTATATARVQHDVRQQLCIPRCVCFKSSFNRPNLRWAAALGRHKMTHLSSQLCLNVAMHLTRLAHVALFRATPRYFVRKKGKSAAQDIGELLTKK